jgi:hypothetical protein
VPHDGLAGVGDTHRDDALLIARQRCRVCIVPTTHVRDPLPGSAISRSEEHGVRPVPDGVRPHPEGHESAWTGCDVEHLDPVEDTLPAHARPVLAIGREPPESVARLAVVAIADRDEPLRAHRHGYCLFAVAGIVRSHALGSRPDDVGPRDDVRGNGGWG